MRVVVVGGGVSGLAAAVFLARRGAEVRVLEAGAAPGGNTRSTREAGFIVDHAANGWLDSEPAMDRLLEAAGLTDQKVRASDRYAKRFIYADGRSLPLPAKPPAFLASPLLSWGAKLRLACEILIPRGGRPDETVASFVRRRLGQQVVDRLVAPMVAGVYGGDPDHLALEAAFPRMAELEREHRSLILAMIRLRRGGAPAGHLTTLRGGAGALPEGLAAWLGERVRCGLAVEGLERRAEGWRVRTAEGALEADAVVLATPAWTAAELIAPHDAEGAAALAAIPYSPISVVGLAWEPGAFEAPPDGFGALAARGSALGALGALYTSCIFPEQAPDGHVLVRVMIGGSVDPAAAALDEQALRGRALAAVGRLLGPTRAPPAHTWIFRHPRGIPQYAPGHLGRVAAARAAAERNPGLHLCGNHLDGIGLKDCAKAAEKVAARLVAQSDSSSATAASSSGSRPSA